MVPDRERHFSPENVIVLSLDRGKWLLESFIRIAFDNTEDTIALS